MNDVTYSAVPCYQGDPGPSRVYTTLNQALEYAEFAAESYGSPYTVWRVENDGDAVFVRCMCRYPGRAPAA